ncbi:MAG: hypothetical protein GXY06_06295 [Clostridiaceae bacterium]|nr:hypothetical protein [Clostridiaceae bacterium]
MKDRQIEEQRDPDAIETKEESEHTNAVPLNIDTEFRELRRKEWAKHIFYIPAGARKFMLISACIFLMLAATPQNDIFDLIQSLGLYCVLVVIVVVSVISFNIYRVFFEKSK